MTIFRRIQMQILFHNLEQEKEVSDNKKNILKINIHASISGIPLFPLISWIFRKKVTVTELSHPASLTYNFMTCCILS